MRARRRRDGMRLGVARALVGGEWVEGDVEVRDGLVAAVGLGEPKGSRVAAPGLVDLQVNGFAGVDFSAADADGFPRAARALVASGVTAYQPTLVTAPIEEMVASIGRIGEVEGGPHLIGVHLEGPFISPERPGAHDPTAIRAPDPEALERLLAAGRVSQVTLAPEQPGAFDLIKALAARGVVVSLGHTDDDGTAASTAFAIGATAVTHVLNAMRPPTAREPGVAFAALGNVGRGPDPAEVFVTAIVDGEHLDFDTVRTLWRAAGERFVLISDNVAGAGAPNGIYTLGGHSPIARDWQYSRTVADGTLAGTSLTMFEAVRQLAVFGGIPLAAALRAATEAPARMARRPDLGRIEVGGRADLIVLEDALESDLHIESRLPLRQVLFGGEPVLD
jgi:N-acetylglucosamine-6-phosphate deacetylase